MNSQFLEWFVGFTEGDGSFIVSKNKVYFDITQSLSDIQVLYYIKKELGFGKVLIREEEHRNVGVFYVSSKENFTNLIHIFNGNLSTRPPAVVRFARPAGFLTWPLSGSSEENYSL